jgi:hypothetical protein
MRETRPGTDPYALGEPHPDVGTDDSVARMTE